MTTEVETVNQQVAKSIRVVVVDEKGITWHLDCAEAVVKSLHGDTVTITGATVRMD